MASGSLAGKTALVTGGASGIGLATVEALVARGARVALNHLPSDERGAEAAARLSAAGHEVICAPGDISRPGEAEEMVSMAITRLGRLDYLVNNAGTPGVAEPIPAEDLDRLSEEFWEVLISTNLLGHFRCVRAAAEALRSASGAICNTASIAGVTARGSSLAYSACKAGLINMTRSLARGLAPNVRVNAVAPGFVDTQWTKDFPAAGREASIAATPLGRLCQPADIAQVIVFLCADATMVTGQTVVVDGGLTL